MVKATDIIMSRFLKLLCSYNFCGTVLNEMAVTE